MLFPVNAYVIFVNIVLVFLFYAIIMLVLFIFIHANFHVFIANIVNFVYVALMLVFFIFVLWCCILFNCYLLTSFVY